LSDLFENKPSIHIPSKSEMAEKSPLKREIWNKILNDDWMWCVVWGKPRTGKTTIQMLSAFDVYRDWDSVIQSCFFNLNGFLYKMHKGEPCRIPTLNGLHFRIPILLADDFGAQCNKAKIQHEQAWDIVKGAWDTLATKVAVLMGSMGTPSGSTQQIQEKYTHEVYVYERGKAKYDEVDWRQDFYGWRSTPNKTWIHDFDFGFDVPLDVYKQYDEMRMGLVDELIQQIEDCQIENEGARIFRLLTDKDVELIELFFSRGQLSNDWFHKPENEHLVEVLKKCRSRGIIVPVLHGTNTYWYDLTDFGLNILTLIQAKKQKGEFAPKAVETVKSVIS
jgi:hypothetical protein